MNGKEISISAGDGVRLPARAPIEDIADINRAGGIFGFSVQSDGREHPVHQLPADTNKRFSLPIFVRPPALRRQS
jgi:hypothetical protein